MDYLPVLPAEINERIVQSIDLGSFCPMAHVCHSWLRMSRSQYLMRHLMKTFFNDFELFGQSYMEDLSDYPSRNWPLIPETADHYARFIAEVANRKQTADTLSGDEVDAILVDTAPDRPGSETSHEFIIDPSPFAADVLFANNGDQILKKQLWTEPYSRGLLVLIKIALRIPLQEVLPFIQRIFHIALAGLKMKFQDDKFIRLFIDLFKRVASILTQRQLFYYLNVLTRELLHYACNYHTHTKETIQALQELFDEVLTLTITSPFVTSRLIQRLLNTSSALESGYIQKEYDFEHVGFLEVLMNLIVAVPYKTRRALSPEHIPDVQNKKPIHVPAFTALGYKTAAIIGCSFGVHFLIQNVASSTFLAKEGPIPTLHYLRDRCLSLLLTQTGKHNFVQQNLKQFVVLASCCLVSNSVGQYIPMRLAFNYSLIQDAVTDPKFNTGNEELTKLAIKYCTEDVTAMFHMVKLSQ